jgi:hypothetical protein
LAIERPIFIVGTGRCGSTVFHEILTRHPHVCYLTRLCDRYPTLPGRNRLANRASDLPGVGRLAWRRWRPSEAWTFWGHHVPGFDRPCRDLTAADVLPSVARHVRELFERFPVGRRRRLLVKLTGWPRMGLLSEIFPDALFIHVLRDGRAVVNSFMRVAFWDGWRGPSQWRWGALTEPEQAEWEGDDRSFVSLAAIQWKRLMDAFERAGERVAPGRLLELRYETLAADPVREFGRVLEFCGLPYPPSFRAAVERSGLRSTNFKWREDFTPEQQRVLESSLAGHLARWGYGS